MITFLEKLENWMKSYSDGIVELKGCKESLEDIL